MKKTIIICFWLLIITLVFPVFSSGKMVTKFKDKSGVLVISSGGFGHNQNDDIEAAVVKRCPKADMVSVAPWDAYKIDLLPVIEAYGQNKKIVLIGHSFGCDSAIHTSFRMKHVDLLVLIDPVSTKWGDLPFPCNAVRILAYKRSIAIGPPVAKIDGLNIQNITGGHNDLPHDPLVIDPVIALINELSGSD